MQGSLAGRLRLILAALTALAAAPASAVEVYVPVLNPVANDGSRSETELWISNAGSASTPYAVTFLTADTDGTQRPGQGTSTPVPEGRSFNVTKVAQAGKVGLLAINVGSGLLVDARVVSTAPSGAVAVTQAPVISEATRLAAGAKAELLGLERDPERGRLLHFGLVNLGTQPAQCQVSFFKTDGAVIAANVALALKPLSLLHFQDALGILGVGRINGVRAEVTCNQPFYAYGAQFVWPNSHYLFITPATTSTTSGGGQPPPPPPAAGAVVFERAGLIHTATQSTPKGRLAVTAAQALSLKRLVLDMDFVAGPWNTEKIPGNHGIVWLYRGKFRSNTVANVNAFGPNKFTVKMNQNVDLSPPSNTSAEGGLTFVQGQRYHLHYVYDAQNRQVSAEVSAGGVLLRRISMAASASGGILTVPATGMTVEFGHYFGQEGPEVAWPGTSYHDLRIEMVPY